MANKKGTYDHTSEQAGGAPSPSPMTEHRDTASPAEPQRNELTPEERNERDDYGPRTHPDTKITRKSGE